MRRTVTGLVLAALAVLAVGGGYALTRLAGGDRLTAVLPNAIGVEDGTPVQLDGSDVGRVGQVTERDGKALAELDLSALPGPLHAGTTVTVEWRSLLGERYLAVHPGAAGNPVLPRGALVSSGPPQVTVEDILESLDAPTRAHLSSFLRRLDSTMAGHQGDLNQTVAAAGPTVAAMGQVLNGIGGDGQAIRTVLANLHQVTTVLAARKGDLSGTITDLDRLTGAAAAHQRQLSAGLAELPGTLRHARAALDRVPAAADAGVPLLHDLRPAADRLPGVAADLRPVLHRLDPALRQLGPTLHAVDRLFGRTPDLLDRGATVLPRLHTTLDRSGAPLAFLRGYTPEAMGFVSTWGNFFSTYDSAGHFASPMVVTGKTAFDDNPNLTIPGEKVDPRIAPGELVHQPWTDADGSGPR
jgi:phospholipid/cholesterol/gamma-HCH transport system substrate-binding protein